MQISRLFEIVYLLMERGNITAAELAERFEVSIRTIYRDIDLLSGAGIPVYSAKGRGGGFRLLPGYVLDRSLLTDEEQNAILFALQSLSTLQADDDGKLLERVSALFQHSGADFIDVDFTPWGSGPVTKKKFGILKKAILEKRVLAFDYYSARGEKIHREVEPVQLSYKGNMWYLRGHCLLREDVRTFKLSRIENPEILERRFQPRDFPLDSLEDSNPPPGQNAMVHLIMRFSPNVAYRVFDGYGWTGIQENPDGTLDVSIWYPEGEWVIGHLLSYGSDVEVLEPAWIREELCRRAKKIYRQYWNPDTLMSVELCYPEFISGKEVPNMEQVFCQSCGMPMTEDAHFGTDKDGSRNPDYCSYCYKDGAFVQDCTMEEMADFCVDMGKKEGRLTKSLEESKADMMAWFATLKRWKKN